MEIKEYLLENLNTSLLSDPKKINIQFDLVAKYLLNNCSISVNERTYHLSEIEFYYFSDKHPDPYVHKHNNQKQIGLWYFHNVGQDLTFGSDGNYGGILVRAVRDENSGNYLDGPLKTFDELFNKGLLLNNKNSFRITFDDKNEDAFKNVFAYPRVGLNPIGKEEGLKYLLKPYRYLIQPWDTKADRHKIYLFHTYIYGSPEIIENLKIDKSTVKEYEQAFKEGQKATREIIDRITSGKDKMSVTNKCLLLGWYHSHGN